MPTIGDLYRHFSVVVNNGSGCIFQTNSEHYTYILTVKHNVLKDAQTNELLGLEDVKVSRSYVEFKNENYLEVRNIYTLDDKDYAIIEVNKISHPNDYQLKVGRFENNAIVTISGYPQYQRSVDADDIEYRTSLKATVDINRAEKHEYDLTLEESADTFDSGAAENITGFSGSGIFYSKGNEIYLVGVFPKLNDSSARHGKVVGFDLSGYKEIIANNLIERKRDLEAFDYKVDFKEQLMSFTSKYKYIILSLFAFGIAYYIYSNYQSKPSCENFTSESDLNILINGDESNNKTIDAEIDRILVKNIPFRVINKFLEGKTKGISSGIISEISEACGADILIEGTMDNCYYHPISSDFRSYLQNQFYIVDATAAEVKSDIQKISKFLTLYLLDKQKLSYKVNNFKVGNFVNDSLQKQDTVYQMIMQVTAKIAEEVGKQDSALMLYSKIPEGGMNPEFVFKRQEVLAEKMDKPHEAITAQSGLIKIAQQKKDTIQEVRLLEKRAKNYEKTGEKANQLNDYKKIKKIKPSDQNASRKIETLESQVNRTSPNIEANFTPSNLIRATNQLINANQFDKADQLIKNNPTIVNNNPELTALKTEIDYNRNIITATQIPDSVKLKNERLASQIKVDKIRTTVRRLIRQ